MFRSTTLHNSHYASRWIIPAAEDRNDLQAVNDLGYAYALAPDSPEKEAKLLVVLEGFHGYLMKYLCMVVRGTIPNSSTYAGKDAIEFLRTLAPRGSAPGKELNDNTCKSLHLAFKGQTSEDIYDTLVFCFVKAARRYDPHYAEKTKAVCKEISGFTGHMAHSFTLEEVEARVGFPVVGILRALVRKGYLASIVGKKKVIGYCLGQKWPAPLSFFQSGPIGFVYMLQMWFRYYLQQWVESQIFEIESNEGMLQLGDVRNAQGSDASNSPGTSESIQPHGDGNCMNSTGKFRFMADRTLMDAPLDVSRMNLEWVASTTDKLFRDLTVRERTILYLYFHEEQSFKTIGRGQGISAQATSKHFLNIIEKIKLVGHKV